MESIESRIVALRPEYIVVDKPGGIATVPLAASGFPKEQTLLGLVSALYPECSQPMGNHPWEGGVVHRLDTDTSGLVLIARSIRFHQYLRKIQQRGQFIKQYVSQASRGRLAGIPLDGFPPFVFEDPRDAHAGVEISSMFRAYGRGRASVRPVTASSSRAARDKGGSTLYKTTVRMLLEPENGAPCFLCSLSNGFRHQVRCHMAWCGYPLVGDPLYGGMPDSELHLAAVSFQFPDERGILVRHVLRDTPGWFGPGLSASMSHAVGDM